MDLLVVLLDRKLREYYKNYVLPNSLVPGIRICISYLMLCNKRLEFANLN